MSAHTPGPWKVSGDLILADDMPAGQKLIAAAPQLLEALRVLAQWPRQSETVDGHLSSDPRVGLANVRRFARAAITLTEV